MKKIIISLLLCTIAAGSFSQIKISALTTATGKGEGSFLPIVQGGVTKKLRTDSIAAQAKRYADSINAVAIDSVKNYTDSVAGTLTSTVNRVKVTISSAEILNLNSVTKTLIAAPGSGKIIRVISAVLQYNYNSTQYSGNAMAFYINGASVLSTGNGYTNASSNTDFRMASTLLTTSSLVNQPLVCQVSSSNPTTGNGTLDVYITYEVITL